MVLGSDDPNDDKTVDSPDDPDDDEPTPTPNNLSPTSGPTPTFKSCADSPLRMKIVIEGKTRGKSCIWASRKNTESRCSFATVASHCPITCAKYGGNCNVDSQARIRVEKFDSKKMMRTCDPWVKKDASYRCTFRKAVLSRDKRSLDHTKICL